MSLKCKHTMLIVDDEKAITDALQRLFRKAGYNILAASKGREGLEMLKKAESPVSLIISDQRMPEMSGSEFLEKAKEIFPDAIRFLLTGYSDMDAIVDAINKGEIHRYFTKPWNDDDLLLQVRESLDHYELKKVNKKLEKSFMSTVKVLSSFVETLNPHLGKYLRKVASLSRSVAEEFELSEEELDQIEIAGTLHDIGLLGVSEHIVKKDVEDMTEREFKIFSEHPTIGHICLESVEHLSEVCEMVLYHHEHYDGSGIPEALRGEEIPLGSRIISVVADYCKIIYMWPREINQIIERAHKYLGPTVKNLSITDPKELIEEISKKIVMLGGNQKYDLNVVLKMIKKIGEREREEIKKRKQIYQVKLENLIIGMILAKNLRTNDGRILMQKDTELTESKIESIQTLGKESVIDNRIHVFLSSELEKKLKEMKKEGLERQKRISQIPLEDLKEGMILAKNLRTNEGRILMPKDTELTESKIESIQKLGKEASIDNQIHVMK